MAGNHNPDLAGIFRPFLPARTPCALRALLCALPLILALVATTTLTVTPALAQGKHSVPGQKKTAPAKTKDEARKVLGPSSTKPASVNPDAPATSPAPGSDAATPRAWSIVVESFTGDDAAQSAAQRVPAVADALGRSDVYVRTTERGAAVVVGRYDQPAAARADLDRVRATTVSNNLPFAAAFLAPPPEASDPGQLPELNLEAARNTFGDRAQYTLQIGVYEARNRDEAKRAAEEAALRLRREGELAFYYHGPTRSMVTVGVFSDDDFDASSRPKSAGMIALQSRYALNLLNGQYPIIEKRPGQKDRQQPSMLVRIP
jgi:hypothetical protein